MAEHVALKKRELWNTDRGLCSARYAGPILDFVRRWSERTESGAARLVGLLDTTGSKFYNRRERYRKLKEQNGWFPRDSWLAEWEKQSIIAFHLKNPLQRYRWLTFVMLAADIVAVSPASVWRVLSRPRGQRKLNRKPSKKGAGFEKPPQPHRHIDDFCLNARAIFYYLCSILDGYGRSIVQWDLWVSITEADIEVILKRAREKNPEAKPRSISDTGPRFIAWDLTEFICIPGMTHVRTSPCYPQSNGKLERWHKSLKSECIRLGTPLTREDASLLIQTYVDH